MDKFGQLINAIGIILFEERPLVIRPCSGHPARHPWLAFITCRMPLAFAMLLRSTVLHPHVRALLIKYKKNRHPGFAQRRPGPPSYNRRVKKSASYGAK